MKILEKLSQIKDKCSRLIFGVNYLNSLERRIQILITFISAIIILVGFITNILIGINSYANLVMIVGFLLLIYYFLMARNSPKYQKTIIQLFITSIVLLASTWFLNAGFDGNISNLMFVYFLAIFSIVKQNQRRYVFVSFLMMYSFLVIIQYLYPQTVIPYTNPQQRFVDLLAGGILYYFFIYFIIDIIIQSYSTENKEMIIKSNELEAKNKIIADNIQKLTESEEKYRFLVDNTADTISLFDLELNLIYCSPSIFKFRGFKPEELINRNLIEFTTPESFRNALILMSEELAIEKSEIANPTRTRVLELEQYRKDGSIIWTENTVKFARDENNNITGILAVSKDITERKNVVENLKEISNRLSMAMNASKQAWFDLDIQTGNIEISEEYPALIGYDNKDFISSFQNWLDNIHPEDKEKLLQAFQIALETGANSTFEYRRMTKDGEWKWMRSLGKVIEYTQDGKPKRMIGTHMDIDDRKKAEKNKELSEGKYRQLFEINKDGIAIFSVSPNEKAPKFLEINTEAHRMLGYTREEMLQLSPAQLESDLSEDEIREKHTIFNSEGFATFETTLVHKDGHRISAEFTAQLIQYEGKPAVMNIVRDITDRKIHDENLKKSEEIYRSLLDFAPNAFFQGNVNGDFINVNQKAIELTGYSREELLTMNMSDLFPKKQLIEKPLRYDLLKQGLTITIERDIIRHEGEKLHVEMISKAMPDGTYQCFMSDITERKLAEESLRLREEENSALLRAIPDIMFIQNNEGIYLNYHAPEESVLFSPQELFIGKHMTDVLPSDIVQDFEPVFKKAINSKEIELFEYTIPFLEGPHHFESRVIAFEDDKILSIIRDITDRKKAEEDLLKLNSAIENSREVIFITDAQGIITYMNPEFTNMYGFTREEVIGKCTPRILKSGFNSIESIEDIWNSLLNKQRIIGEYINKTKDGKFIYVEGSAEVILDTNGKIIGFIGIQRDISDRKKAEDAIIESKANLTALIENTSDNIWSVNTDYELMYINEVFKKSFEENYNTKLEVGMNILNVVPQSMKEIWKTRYDRAFQNERFNFEERFVLGNNYFYIEISINPILIGDKVIGASVFSRDITERKHAEEELRNQHKELERQYEQYMQLNEVLRQTNHSLELEKERAEESEERWRTVIKTNPDCIKLLDSEGKIVEMNPSGLDMMQATFSEVTGKSAISVVVDEHKESFKDMLQGVFHGEKRHLIFDIVGLKGRRLTLETIAVPLFDTTEKYKVKLLVGVTRDITERKREDLELIRAKERAEESDKLKTSFLQNISHEIRTPLNGIIGFSKMLVNEDITDEETIEYTDIIQQSGKRLIEIVNNVLDISKIETGQVVVNNKVFSINSMISDLYDFFAPSANAKKLELTYQTPLEDENSIIKTDEAKLNQILTNLINNAIKFTLNGSVSFGYNVINDNLEFYVKDTGIGISKHLHEKIFDRFTQVEDSIGRSYEGAGIGLAICKGLVTMLNGDIRVESELDKGTTFYLTLPFTTTTTNIQYKGKSEIKTQKNIKALKILVAEDDLTSFRYMKKVLSKKNIEVIHAENGIQAIDIVKEEPEISLILMDIRMPIMDGIEATKQIKIIRPDLPIIAQTAYAFSQEKEKILSVGCDDYLSKPIEIEKLMEIVSKYMDD